jgi:hypothetical protein
VIAVFGDNVMVQRHGLVGSLDPVTGESAPVELPESDGRLGHGLVSPSERFVLVVFGNPTWPGPRQLLDLWLLDTATMEWSQLPGMPVATALKALAIAWTPDERMVMLGNFDGVGTAIVTWTPADDQLRLRTMHLRTMHLQTSTSIVTMSGD